MTIGAVLPNDAGIIFPRQTIFTRVGVEGTRPLMNKIDPGYHHWHDTMARIICAKANNVSFIRPV